MLSHIHELYRHQAWADAEHWKCVLAFEPARQDRALRERLLHIHGAQQLWMARWQDLPWSFPDMEQFPEITDILHLAKGCEVAFKHYVGALKAEDLGRTLRGKRLNGEPYECSLQDSLIHVAHHSDYHRGQNATRMRELGSHMGPTGWFDWARLGKPGASWG